MHFHSTMATLASQPDLASEPGVLDARARAADWQEELAHAVRDPVELCRLVGLSSTIAEAGRYAAIRLPVLVPRPYLARIRAGDARDPLLLQVLPSETELSSPPEFTADPLGEASALCAPGLLWKYQNRILILTTPHCAVHCRFCFRRYFLLDSGLQSPFKWDEAFDLISGEPSIHELILSGGDPLVLPDELLGRMAAKFAPIPHLARLRIHTRMPILIPQRVGDDLIAWMRNTGLAAIMVVHVNHPREIDEHVAAALGRLVDAGIPLLSQSVLLAGVNDDLEVLAELYERLADLRVLPYYLHQLDSVAGAAHFRVPLAKGKDLIAGLRARLPGYAVPRYVTEPQGAAAKEILA
jgi:EF-P beta-lysylation protein EpmB